MKSHKDSFFEHISRLQNMICNQLEEVDGGATFKEDHWTRDGGGGGKSKVIANGNVFEKGGVNVSAVHGKLPESMTTYLKVSNNDFYACGLSLVLHPQNPQVPTVHANFRYFELYDKGGNVIDQWFAGGADLTPYYIYSEDVRHFHKTWKDHCDKYHPSFYPKYKKDCDDYFYNHHREEARGVGGIFFDYLRPTEEFSDETWKRFTIDASNAFLPSYLPIVKQRKDQGYSAEEKKWQEIRRGRYVEFNLIHDKGTLFGLKTKGRIESIFMSLPPVVQWEYDFKIDEGTPEAELLKTLKNPVSWTE